MDGSKKLWQRDIEGIDRMTAILEDYVESDWLDEAMRWDLLQWIDESRAESRRLAAEGMRWDLAQWIDDGRAEWKRLAEGDIEEWDHLQKALESQSRTEGLRYELTKLVLDLAIVEARRSAKTTEG